MPRPAEPKPVLIDLPARITSHVVFASPHSGRVYPEDIIRRALVSPQMLRSSEDAFVDLLLAPAPSAGAPLVTTEVPRAYVDFNRAETELDPALISGLSGRVAISPRVASGLGVIARVVANGQRIYPDRLTLAEAEGRIDRCWRPYHAALAGLLADQRARFGRTLLVDVHSMPRAALAGYPRLRGGRPDVVLGDRHGASCAPDLVDAVAAVFQAEGLVVARNTPFAGAYIAERYGRPGQGMHCLQIEIDRGLYLDERRVTPGPGFADVQAMMARAVVSIAALGRAGALPLAAE
ncbi:N-formylglutamate amidohydrolase [Cecembia sp.]|uniref:N-formylglutamate amidohydrolase n=1 Tax=Cecembia sp. TaxID=1898110 RepID=UPI0025C4D5E3|nr:N-formylglutamate amidohydrolase [Cecembia sp.]